MKLLMRWDDIDADPKNMHERMALSWATENGHEGMVKVSCIAHLPP